MMPPGWGEPSPAWWFTRSVRLRVTLAGAAWPFTSSLTARAESAVLISTQASVPPWAASLT